MEWIATNWELIAAGISSVMGLASVIVKLTPSPKDDEWLKKVVGFVGFLQHKDVGGAKLPLTPTKSASERS